MPPTHVHLVRIFHAFMSRPKEPNSRGVKLIFILYLKSQFSLSFLCVCAALHLRHSNSKQGKPILFLYFNVLAPSHFHTHSFNHAFIMHSAIVGKSSLIFFFNNFLVAFPCSCSCFAFLKISNRTATTTSIRIALRTATHHTCLGNRSYYGFK